MILEIIKPTSGSITVLGESSALKVRHRIGYLPEEKGLYKKDEVLGGHRVFRDVEGF